MPTKRKKEWLYASDRNHPDHSQEFIDLMDAMTREFSHGTWPDYQRERKTSWNTIYWHYRKLLSMSRDQQADAPQAASEPLLVYRADLKHYRRPYPVFAEPGQCRGEHINTPWFSGRNCTCLVKAR